MKIHIDFFKPTGKWYTREEFELENNPDARVKVKFEAFLRARLTQEVEGKTRVRFGGMTAVCDDWYGVPHLAKVPDDVQPLLPCPACKFEAAYGTEECPHPVAASIHTCTPVSVGRFETLEDLRCRGVCSKCEGGDHAQCSMPDKCFCPTASLPRTMLVLGVEVLTPHEMVRAAGRALKAEMSDSNRVPCCNRCGRQVAPLTPEGYCGWCSRPTEPNPNFPKPPKTRTCNRHEDCDAADAKVKARYEAASLHEKAHLPLRADHCDDETCEDCFGS